MDIRSFFGKKEETKTSRKKTAPVIIDDDEDDFYTVKKQKPTMAKKPRTRARIKYDSDSEEEEVPQKKVGKFTSPKTDKPHPKRQEVSSPAAFFGTQPIKRTRVSPRKRASPTVVPESPTESESPSQPIMISESPTKSHTLHHDDPNQQISEPPAKKLKQGLKSKLHIKQSPKVSPAKPSLKKSPTPPATPSPKISKGSEKTSDVPEPPKPSRHASYIAYLNREGPKAPGSKETPKGADNCLAGLTFVLTGVGESLDREEAADLVKNYGGRVTTSLSKKTSYLVVGDDAGESKIKKAKELGTKLIDEDGLFDLIRTRPGKGGATPPSSGKTKGGATPVSSNKAKCRATTPTAIKTEGGTTPPTSVKTKAKSPVHPVTPTRPPPSKTLDIATTPTTTTKSIIKTTDNLLWVDKYAPTSTKQIIGQKGDKSNVQKLANWLRDWYSNHGPGTNKKPIARGGGRFGQGDGSSYKAALLSGPPGIGKTTSAVLVCKEAGYTYIELNASAARSKKTLQEVISSSLKSLSMDAFLSGGDQTGKQHVLIMDEVDGMSGNEDKGGVQELIQLIKTSQVPIICICNDRQHPKIRSLANYCYDLRFYKPRPEQIKGPMMSIAFKEGIKITPLALQEIINASCSDIRQILHNLSVWSATDKNLSYDIAKESAQGVKKHIKMGPFDVIKTVFMPVEGERDLNLMEKSNLFFQDYSLGPLFVQENYVRVKPLAADSPHKLLQIMSDSADSIGQGDLVSRLIRSNNAWELLPTQAIFSSVVPGELIRGNLGKPEFPQWLGNNSKRTKYDRNLQELQQHTRLVCSCNKLEFGMDYLPFLHDKLTRPLIYKGTEGVTEVVKNLGHYDLTKEDWENMLELSHYSGRQDVLSQINPKVKAAFTRTYNKEGTTLPYNVQRIVKKQATRTSSLEGDEGEGSEGGASESEEEENASAYRVKPKGGGGKMGGASNKSNTKKRSNKK